MEHLPHFEKAKRQAHLAENVEIELEQLSREAMEVVLNEHDFSLIGAPCDTGDVDLEDDDEDDHRSPAWADDYRSSAWDDFIDRAGYVSALHLDTRQINLLERKIETRLAALEKFKESYACAAYVIFRHAMSFPIIAINLVRKMKGESCLPVWLERFRNQTKVYELLLDVTARAKHEQKQFR